MAMEIFVLGDKWSWINVPNVSEVKEVKTQSWCN